MIRSNQRFQVIGGKTIGMLLAESKLEIVDLIREAYRLHHAGRTINPDSYFLRFPDKPTARIIALTARIQADDDIAGIKWISSFPENRLVDKPRASAVVILNDMATGFPYACLEGSLISAARTAASAALAAELLHKETRAECLAVIGAGPIAATVVDFLLARGWNIGRVRVHDLVARRSEDFCARLRERGLVADPASTTADAVVDSDLVLFATTASKPHLDDPAMFTPAQSILHISLRDLGVPVIRSAFNVVDDVEHCMKAQTSVHLTEGATGGRDFVAGTIGDLISGSLAADQTKLRIFSPFGLGLLDLMLARFVYQKAVARGLAVVVDDFFASEG